MDKLNTCMICTKIFEEDTNVVVVHDATYRGFTWSDDMASFEYDTFEQHAAPERGVYCEGCYGKLVGYSWELARQVNDCRCPNGHDEICPTCKFPIHYASPDDFDYVSMDKNGVAHHEDCQSK